MHHDVGWVNAGNQPRSCSLGNQLHGHARAEAHVQNTIVGLHIEELDDPAIVLVSACHELARESSQRPGRATELS